MNGQTSDYSASYGSRSGGGVQAGMGHSQQPMMSGAPGTTIVGVRQDAQQQMPGLGLSGGALGGARQEPMQGMTFPGASMPMTEINQAQPISTEGTQYMNGFLRTQIGNRISVEFLIGTNTYLTKSGKLLAVGANYIILQESLSDDLLVCDFFTIKFVTIYR
jgi:hypothetical protein